jgi:hypothetical protein
MSDEQDDQTYQQHSAKVRERRNKVGQNNQIRMSDDDKIAKAKEENEILVKETHELTQRLSKLNASIAEIERRRADSLRSSQVCILHYYCVLMSLRLVYGSRGMHACLQVFGWLSDWSIDVCWHSWCLVVFFFVLYYIILHNIQQDELQFYAASQQQAAAFSPAAAGMQAAAAMATTGTPTMAVSMHDAMPMPIVPPYVGVGVGTMTSPAATQNTNAASSSMTSLKKTSLFQQQLLGASQQQQQHEQPAPSASAAGAEQTTSLLAQRKKNKMRIKKNKEQSLKTDPNKRPIWYSITQSSNVWMSVQSEREQELYM